MGFLQRTPEGLLDLTGQRVGGRYPTGFSDSVVGTLDVTPLLTGRLVSSETAASLTSVLGDEATLTVPDNEVWMLFNVSTEVSFYAVGQDVDIKIYLTKIPGSSDPANKLILGNTHYFQNRSPLGANAVVAQAVNFAPIACPPGTEIVANVADASEIDIPWAVHAGLYKLTGN